MTIQKTIRRLSRPLRHNIAYTICRMLLIFSACLPRSLGLAIFGMAGRLVCFISRKSRTVTVQNLKLIYGNKFPDDHIRQNASSVFVEIGKNAFDAFYLAHKPVEILDSLVTCDSLKEMRTEYAKGRGIIALIGHIGCFEMLLHYFALHGFKCLAIGRRLFDPRIDKIFRELRSGADIEYVDRDENPRKMIRLLAEGRIMGALIDQDTKVDGVFSHFLGRLAHTPSGPMRIAMRYNIPVFVVTTARVKNNRHHIFVSQKLDLADTGDKEKDIVTNIESANDIIGKAILRDPSQWVWMHQRWRKQPDYPGMGDVPNIEKYTHV